MKTEVFKDRVGEWRFRFKAANGEIVAHSEGYHNLRDAIDTAHNLQPDATVVVMDDDPGPEAA